MVNRREFLVSASGVSMAVAGGWTTSAAEATSPDVAAGRHRWRKAFMLGQVDGEIGPTFEKLREAGFEGVELISPNSLNRDEVLKSRDATGLVIHGVSGAVHWAKPLSHPDQQVALQGVAAIKQEIDDCRAYGGTTVLVVPAVVTPDVSHREAEERSHLHINNFLLNDAKEKGTVLAIEEVWNKFLLTAPEFARYIDSFQSPWVRAYFDVGNVVEYGYPQEWIHELGPRIAKIHVKEYSKAKRFDYKLGEGEIDWKAVREALIDVGYDGWITAEVPASSLEDYKDVVKRMDDVLGG